MKLTVLGKYGPYPAADGATSGYLLQTDNTNILIDCGGGVAARLQKFVALQSLDAIIITHLHGDHFSDILFLKYMVQKSKKIVPLYAPKTPQKESKIIQSSKAFAFNALEAGRTLQIGGVAVATQKTLHPVETYALRLFDGKKTFVYSSDTKAFEGLEGFVLGADFLLCDCAQSAQNYDCKNPHMNIAQGALLAKKTGVPLLATHINPDCDICAEARELGVELAEEGKTYII